MGVQPSKISEDEKAYYADTPVRFSPGLINHLDDQLASSSPSSPDAARQSTLDAHVRSRIRSELDRLRAQEAEVRAEIERALERENLDREQGGSGVASEEKQVGDEARRTNSVILARDLDEIRRKIERHHQKRDLASYPDIKAAQEGLVACFRDRKGRTLDCWRQVDDFKAAIAKAEKDFVASFA